MVVASVSTEAVKQDLKTCDGGFVRLRRMSFGEKLFRQELATKQAAMVNDGSRKVDRLDIQLLSTKVAEWEFANLIIEHNLEWVGPDGEAQPFQFGRKGELQRLDPRIGDEINNYIAEMNNYEEEDQRGN